MTKEALGELILSSERQLYATAKTILSDDQDCADAIQESIVKAFSKIDTLKKMLCKDLVDADINQ